MKRFGYHIKKTIVKNAAKEMKNVSKVQNVPKLQNVSKLQETNSIMPPSPERATYNLWQSSF